MTKLNLIMKYKFVEEKLGTDFCKEKVEAVRKLVDSSISFFIVGMPALGISIFLRYLATTPIAYFVHVDVYELSSLDKTEFCRLLLKELGGTSDLKDYQKLFDLCKRHLHLLTRKYKRVVIIFNRFDQLKEQFDSSFFNNLRALRDVDKERIVMIFAANKPLYEIAPEAIVGGNLNMYSKTFYLEPYSHEDLLKLLKLNAPGLTGDKVVLERALRLSGGHYQLLLLLLKSERLSNPLLDQFVNIQLKGLYECLNYIQKKQVRQIALGRTNGELNNYLSDVGLVVGRSGAYRLFTPLLEKFIKSHLPFKLPPRENRLFALLKNNLDKTVSKDEIFKVVWKEDYEDVSDWALNALIYRLRKNPVFTSSGYLIESQKGIGYILTRL